MKFLGLWDLQREVGSSATTKHRSFIQINDAVSVKVIYASQGSSLQRLAHGH